MQTQARGVYDEYEMEMLDFIVASAGQVSLHVASIPKNCDVFRRSVHDQLSLCTLAVVVASFLHSSDCDVLVACEANFVPSPAVSSITYA
eukprot:scaffold70680_cov15-Tisochrysis_lutea.AAC.3